MTSNYLPALPIIIMLISTIGSFISWHFAKAQRWITVIGCGLLLLSTLWLLLNVLKHGIIICYVSGWHAPFGITLVIDGFSVLMLLLTAITSFTVAIYSCGDLRSHHIASGFYPAFCILVIGLCGAFSTGDFFNLYVWFEVTVIGSFVLITCGGNKAQLDGAVRYVILNLIATLILLTAIALLYGITGTLNMADMAQNLINVQASGLVRAISILLLLAFAMKAALFPLFFWLPASYHTPSFSASSIFAALLSKLGVYALIRSVTLVFPHDPVLHDILWLLGLLTLLTGIFGAMSQYRLRRIFSFTLISHIGYMIVGLAIGTPLALAAAIFYLFQHVIIKANLFMISGVIERYAGQTNLNNMSSFYRTHPWIAILFIIPGLALAGFPPLSGFWPKLMLIMAAAQQHAYITIFIMLVVSLLTLFIIIKIWMRVFLRESQQQHQVITISPKNKYFLLAPSIILSLLILIISFAPLPLYNMATIVSHQLLDPQFYLQAVLRGHL